jgi:PPK2 family polyphosphate:nucleotide phosphotransferase
MSKLGPLKIDERKNVRLADIDPDDTSLAPGGKEETRAASEALCAKLGDLQELLFAGHHHKLLVVLQGMDTSGKDGTVRHVMNGVSPQSVRVTSFKKPMEQEADHDYLWRVHAAVPGNGEIAIFNRSHYEEVLVVRVHKLVPEKVWKKRYGQIRDFEEMLAENGITILKFFLHISRDEQRKRLQARLDDPTKRWKFQHGDVEERRLWDDYQRAYEDAIGKTSTKSAPWIIVPANAKWYRNWLVARTIVQELEELKMTYPQPDLSGETID